MSFDARMNVKPVHTSSMPGPKSRRGHRLRNCAFSFFHPMVDNGSSILLPMSPRLLGKVTHIETLQVAPHLPPELWLGIAAQCTQSTIAALARVQRSWYLALESELYRHVSVVFRPGDLVTSQACIRLLWSLAQTPRRATFVHSLSVNTLREAMTACDQCKRGGHRTCTRLNVPRPDKMLKKYLKKFPGDAQTAPMPPEKLVFEIASRHLVQCSAQQSENLLILWTHIYLALVSCPNLSEVEIPAQRTHDTTLETGFLALFARPNAQDRQWSIPAMIMTNFDLQQGRNDMLALISSSVTRDRSPSRVLVVKSALTNLTPPKVDFTQLATHGVSAVILDERGLAGVLTIALRPYCEDSTGTGIGLKMQRYINDLRLFATRRARAATQGTFDLGIIQPTGYRHSVGAIPVLNRLVISLTVAQLPFVLRRVLEAFGPLLPSFRQVVLSFSTDETSQVPAGFGLISAETFAQILIPLVNLEVLEFGAFETSTLASYMLFGERELVAASKSIGGCLSTVSFSESDGHRRLW